MQWTDLTAFQRDTLAAISHLETYSDQECYGLAIKRELQKRRDEEINHGRLYPNLDELVEAGLVEKSQLDKRTNEYRLTDDGAAQLQDRLKRLALDCGIRGDDQAAAQTYAGP